MARLGTVGASRLALIAPQPEAPDLFSGLVGALGRRQTAMLQNEDSVNALQDAEDQRNLKLERSRALVALSDTKAQIEIEQAELAKTYDPSGVDFRKKSDEITNRRMAEFRGTLSPDLVPEFDPDIATYRNDRSALAYNAQYSMEGANYKKGLVDLQKRALDSIFLGQSTIEDWTPQLQAYFDNSPLTPAETELLIEETNRSMQSMEFAKQAEDETTNWIEYNGTDASGMPSGMPGYAVGLMGAITATESGGKYNVLNGGETFTDMSDHPRRVGAGGTSTAAGKYQFVEATWDRAAAALNLPDFSPASQEKAAWWLAQQDYGARTGRNLDADLASGDPVLIENVRKVLGGQGDADVTWKGLQHLSTADFYAYITGGKAVPPGIMDDPAYSSLTAVEKQNMLILAQKQADEHLAAMLKAQNAQRDMLVGQMKEAITAGAMTPQQLSDFIGTQGATQEQAAELTKLYGEHNKDEGYLQKFGAALQTGGATFGEEERKGFDVLYARESSKAVEEQDQEYMNSTVLPFVGRSGYFPQQLVTDLSNMARGTDPQRAAFAWQNIALLQQQNGLGFEKAFGEGFASDVTFFRQRSNYYAPNEVMQQMLDASDPTKRVAAEVVKKEAETYVKANAKYFSAAGIADQMGLELDVVASDLTQLSAFESEFLDVFNTELSRYRDGDEAYEAAKARLASKWDTVSYGSDKPYLLRNSPAKAGVSAIGGGLDWIDTYVREQTGITGAYRFSSDHITEADINSGGKPSYLILEDYGNGVFLPKVNENGVPQRLELNPPDAKEQSLDAELWFRQAHNMDALYTRLSVVGELKGPAAASLETIVQAARTQFIKDKPKYASSKGLLYEQYQDLPPTVGIMELKPELAKFGFGSLSEFIDFMNTGDMDQLMERYKQ